MKMLSVLIIFLFLGHTNDYETIDLVISNPKIIDVENGSILLNHDILIRGNVIVGIVPHKKIYAKSIKLVDAQNMYAIPGLWDMHVHALYPGFFEISNLLMLANGVTGFRDMWGDMSLADTVKIKMQSGEIPFQRFIVAGGLVDGAIAIWPGSQVADSPERGIEIVDSLYKAGSDFIKVYSRLTPETFNAIAKRCKELNIKFAGHVPTKVNLVDASNAGMYSMEHLYGLADVFSDIEDSIRMLTAKIDFARGDPATTAALSADRLNMLLRSKVVPAKVEKVCGVLRANHTWIVPTSVVRRGISYMDVLDTVKDERLDYLPYELTDGWKIKNDFRVRNRSEKDWEDAKAFYKKGNDFVTLLHKNNVPMLSGTDFPNPYCFPGYSLHDELQLMNEAGLTPLEVLQTATINPAKYLNKTDSLGTIPPNKYADILLLAENPLTNISNTKKIEGLLVSGKFYNKQDLESLKQRAKDFSKK
jgi:hypothetical protein